MNWKRVGRLLVCLVLVAALLVQVSPIRAKAFSPGLVYVAAGAVIMGILWGVGVSAGVNGSEAFLDVCNDALNGLTLNYDFITDDQKIKAWATGNPDMPWMIDESIIDAVFGWLYTSSTIVDRSTFFSGASANVLNAVETAASYTYVKVARWPSSSGYTYGVMGNDSSPFISVEKENMLLCVRSDSENFYYSYNGGSFKSVPNVCLINYGMSGSYEVLNSDLSVDVFTYSDLTLGEVAPSGTAIPDGYSIWNDNAILVQDDDGSHYVYPLTLPADFEDIKDLSQGDIWEGIGSTYEDTTTDTETGSGTGTGTGSGTTAGTAADVVTGVVSGLQDQTAQIGVWLGELIAGVQAIPQAIADVLTAIFVPSADYVTAKVESLRARFPFISSVISTGESLRDSISGSSGPPAIYVDLGRASSGNYGSQKVLLTDFAWYAEYKPTVDAVLSAALWAFFGWRVFLKLPGIISGESGVVGDISARAETYNKIKAGPPTKK